MFEDLRSTCTNLTLITVSSQRIAGSHTTKLVTYFLDIFLS